MTKVLSVIGLIIFLVSILFIKSLEKGEQYAYSLDTQSESYGYTLGPPPCKWEVTPPERVINENKSVSVLVSTKNELDEPCESILYLRAPNFDLSPASDNQKVALSATSSGSISWIITPRRTGSYELSITDNMNTKIMGITVKNMFGLSAVQGKLASMAGTVFGPMLTIPWWWDRFKKKKTSDNPVT